MDRVQKLLSNYGYCSRRKAETLIIEGRVKVNGKLISIGDKASGSDEISVDGKSIIKENKVYLMLNKPTKYVTALKDDYHKPVIELIRIKERVFPIGRLDYNTTGLLLFTNDGDFANKLMHPRYEIKKTYVVRTNRPIKGSDIKRLENGIKLEDGKTSPARVKKLDDCVFEITIHEGKNRVIRRMLEVLSLKTRSLERIKIGSLSLGSLKEGRFRKLTKKEVDSFL